MTIKDFNLPWKVETITDEPAIYYGVYDKNDKLIARFNELEYAQLVIDTMSYCYDKNKSI